METDCMLPKPAATNEQTTKSKAQNVEIFRSQGISATSNLINFVCGMLGPGCFSVAMSFHLAGLWAGLILMVVIGLLSLLSMYKIILCSQSLAMKLGDKSLDYGQMAKEACNNSYDFLKPHAQKAQILVNMCLICFQLGVLSISLVFVSEHIIEILQFFYGEDHHYSIIHIILIYFIPQICINLVGNIKFITAFSVFGNFAIFAAIALITKELIFHSRYPTYSLPAVTNINGITIAAGGLIYAFEGQAMVLPLENKLKHSRDMIGATGVLATSMNLVILIYIFIGFFGYITFGPNVAGSLTLNLPTNLISTVVKMLLIGKVFVGSALQILVIVEMIHNPFKRKYEKTSPKTSKLAEFIIRIAISVVALIFAVTVPNLAEIIPFVGITSGMLLSFILPATIDMIVFLPQTKKNIGSILYRTMPNLFIFLLGWFFMIMGLYSSTTAFFRK